MSETKKDTLTLADMKKLAGRIGSGGRPWRYDIADYLKEHQGASEQEIFEATRGKDAVSKKGEKFSQDQIKHNLASQYTYLRKEYFIVDKRDDGVYLLTEPNPTKKGEFNILRDRERILAILNS